MSFPTRLIVLVALGAAGSTGGLAAQVRFLPVRNAGVGTGIGIAADVGFPNATNGSGLAFGATGAIGLGPLGVTGTVAHYNPKGAVPSSFNSVGVTGNLKIFGGPLVPVSVTLQAGVAYDKVALGTAGDSKTWHVPVGVGLALTIPNPVFSIKPWVAPRVDVLRGKLSYNSPPNSFTDTQTKFGISGGVDLGFLSGLAFRAMYDRVKFATDSSGHGVYASVLSFGLGFKVGT